MIVHSPVFEAPRREYRVVVEAESLKRMFALSAKAGKHETGGILIGRYADAGATAIVDEVTDPPADSKAGPNWFHRGTRGLRDLMQARWDAKPRRYYLGEWHFHTALVPWPSGQDLHQMKEIADNDQYKCHEPVLVIVCPEAKGQRSVRAFVFPRGEAPVELRVVDHHDVSATRRGQAHTLREPL